MMPLINRLFPQPRRWLLWAGAGFLFRLAFIWFPRASDDDTADYLQLGHNLLHYGVYGLGNVGDVAPTLFRVPGYPILLATFEQLFSRAWPGSWMNTVLIFQAIVDVAGGLLLSSFARRHLSGRAAEFALVLAMLCPFTAAFTGVALTESLSVFAIALGIYAADLALIAERNGRHDLPVLILAGCAGALAALLRPDGALLCMVLAAGLFWYTLHPNTLENRWRPRLGRALGATAIYCLVALLPLAVWTLRNFVQFRTFQPLAPRYLNDPGERYNAGYYRWMRTWAVEYVTTANVFWHVGLEKIEPDDLPPRAFDSDAQREQTLRLIAEYNVNDSISAELDSRFAALATERIRAHPFSYYMGVPFLRVADMLLRPRTWEFNLDPFWWRWSEDRGQTMFAVLIFVINLFFVGASILAFVRGRVPWAWMLGGYVLLRLMFLGTMENSEPRYTLECFPVFIIATAAMFEGQRNAGTESTLCQPDRAL